MSNKSTEANFHIVTPQGGVNQRDDIASLDEKTFSNLEGIRPTQTGLLERILGKAILAKYTDAIWGIVQCWTPNGLIAGYTQYGGSITYQPWALTWGPINVTPPAYLPIDPNNYTVGASPTSDVDTGGDNTSSGAAGGSGSNPTRHVVFQTTALSVSSNVQYSTYVSKTVQVGTSPTIPTFTIADLPPLPFSYTPTLGNSYSSGFKAQAQYAGSVYWGYVTGPPAYYTISTNAYVNETHNVFQTNFTLPTGGFSPQYQLQQSARLVFNGPEVTLGYIWIPVVNGATVDGRTYLTNYPIVYAGGSQGAYTNNELAVWVDTVGDIRYSIVVIS